VETSVKAKKRLCTQNFPRPNRKKKIIFLVFRSNGKENYLPKKIAEPNIRALARLKMKA
jgi:hypothetical protein